MKYLIILLVAIGFSSCDWLDIEPKTNIKEENVFNKEQGFKEALTGIYIKMTVDELYGNNLTFGFLDQLAQRYVSPVEPKNNIRYDDFEFYIFSSGSANARTYTDKIWEKSYNVIANINNLIKHIEEDKGVIQTKGLKNIIHGEALGLRAFLHFDLLRMFGPLYQSKPDDPSIPYRDQFNRDVRKLLPASEIVEKVIEDLKKAEELLADDAMVNSYQYDPLHEPNFLDRRSKRMNKYAVKALLARVYMYKGDLKLAKDKANEVIEAKYEEDNNKIFSFVVDNSTDHLLSKELIFALSMDNIQFPVFVSKEFVNSQFSSVCVGDKDRLYEMFDVPVDGINDIRMKDAGGFLITNNSCVTKKYFQDNSSPMMNNTMPLIRLAEMYYIVAEATEDLTESAKILSKVRKARALESIPAFDSEEDKNNNIEKEYRKEFYAEGQLWFFYKRKEYTTFQFCPLFEMTEEHYRFSIPDNEKTFGNL